MTLTQRQQKNKELKLPFKDLSFEEEEHKYTIKGFEDRPIKSVSGLLKYFYDEFETEKVSERWGASRDLDPEMVRAAWEGEGEIANKHGSAVHLIGEQYLNYKFLGKGECPVPIDKQSLGAIQFLRDLPDYLVPVASELQMYNEEMWYSGTADIILYNTKTKKYIIADYKTNKSLTNKYEKEFLHHLGSKYKLLQDNFGKYTLQFSFYQILMEEAGFPVQSRVLIHLEEDKYKKKLYKTYKTLNVTPDLREWLKNKPHFN